MNSSGNDRQRLVGDRSLQTRCPRLPIVLAFAWVLLGLLPGILPACRETQTAKDGWKPSRPVDFSYQMDGKQAQIAQLRGRPLVLILMRTSELPSQVYMQEVRQAFVKIAGVVQFLVLTIEQREAPFVQPYVAAEKLPFNIGIAEPDVGSGLSPLGFIPTMPTTYILDSKGQVFDAAAGVVKADQLIQAIQQVDKP